MSGHAQLQSSRYELKYLVSEALAWKVREFFRPYVSPDPFTAAADDPSGYLVCSLYLDSPRLDLYDQTCKGAKNRFKLRVRIYDDDESSPAFVEIKRRDDRVIRKKRAALTREGASRILLGEAPSTRFFHKASAASCRAYEALQEFCRLRDQLRARGCTYVLYQREAYGSPGSNKVRVTFDRCLEGGEHVANTALSLPERRTVSTVDGVVLELKFTGRFPNWMRDLVQTFGLEATSVAKYCKCVEVLRIRALPQPEVLQRGAQ